MTSANRACNLAVSALLGWLGWAAAAAGQGSATSPASLSVAFTGQPPGAARVYASGETAPAGTLRVVNGGTAILRAESGRHFELRAGGWRWSQVQEVPANVSAVRLTPRLDGDRVVVELSVYQQEQDRRRSFSTTVAGAPGEWLHVLGPPPQRRPGGRLYSTGSPDLSGGATPVLYLRVEAVEDSR